MNAIEVRALKKMFGTFTAVNEVTFNVEDSEIFGLLGPNGAGKTTLIRMLTTLTPPTSGSATVAGHDIVKDADGVRKSMGVIPQAMTSDPELTAEENMLIHAKLFGVPAEKRTELMERLLESVGLEKFRTALVRTFSGGMRRRLEIARGLMHSPRILFLDEPTTGLDPVSRTNVWEMIDHLRDDQKLTILLTTHYMDEADKLCDRVAIVDHGDLKALDSPIALKQSIPGHDSVDAEFEQEPEGWLDELRGLEEVAEVKSHEGVFRLASHNGPRTIAALMELARKRGVTVHRISVENTTLDDVFLYYTGRGLRDAVGGGRYDISHLYKH